MPARHRSRERALKILFQADLREQPAEQVIAEFYDSQPGREESEPPPEPDPFMEELVKGVLSHRQQLDRLIASHSVHWRLERMPVVDRNILRLAVHEMIEMGTPPAVVIDEALELARRYSGAESIAFINGVLDAIHRAGAKLES